MTAQGYMINAAGCYLKFSMSRGFGSRGGQVLPAWGPPDSLETSLVRETKKKTKEFVFFFVCLYFLDVA